MAENDTSWCPPQPPAQPQQDRRQFIKGEDLSSLCHLGWQPLLLTGVFLNVVRSHFANPSFIEDPALSALIWQAVGTPGILIDSVFKYRAALADLRPAILVKRNGYQNIRHAIGDKVKADEQGNVHYQTWWVGSHSLFCVHKEGAACEILATETQREFTRFAPAIVDSLGLYRLQVTEVGGISTVEEATQMFVVPVTVGWAYSESWVLRQEQLPLTAIALGIQPRGGF